MVPPMLCFQNQNFRDRIIEFLLKSSILAAKARRCLSLRCQQHLLFLPVSAFCLFQLPAWEELLSGCIEAQWTLSEICAVNNEAQAVPAVSGEGGNSSFPCRNSVAHFYYDNISSKMAAFVAVNPQQVNCRNGQRTRH